MVERNLAKVEVESSRLFSRSNFQKREAVASLFFKEMQISGAVAKRLCPGLQIRLDQFDSGPRLQKRSIESMTYKRILAVRFCFLALKSLQTAYSRSQSVAQPRVGSRVFVPLRALAPHRSDAGACAIARMHGRKPFQPSPRKNLLSCGQLTLLKRHGMGLQTGCTGAWRKRFESQFHLPQKV